MEVASTTVAQGSTQQVCPVCHQPVLPSYYFCPNCGKNLKPAPLPTDAATQLWLYLFSIILPMICFLFVTRWKGLAYLRSSRERERRIGRIATVLIVLSTIFVVWYAIQWTNQAIQQSVAAVNAATMGY